MTGCRVSQVVPDHVSEGQSTVCHPDRTVGKLTDSDGLRHNVARHTVASSPWIERVGEVDLGTKYNTSGEM